MDRAPLVSVCIPAYNAGPYLEEAIRSVLRQTFEDWELIISDDHSTDGTIDTIRQFSEERLRIFTSAENRGAAANWNFALRQARGTYVKLLCHDDLIYPDCLESQAAALEANPASALVCCRRDVIDAAGTVLLRSRGWRGRAGEIRARAAQRAIIRSGTNPVGEPAAVLFRAEAAGTIDGFSGNNLYMIDVDFWLRLLDVGNLLVQEECLAAFRLSDNSLSARLARRQASEARRFFREFHRQRPSEVSWRDMATGCVNATLLAPARRWFFRRQERARCRQVQGS